MRDERGFLFSGMSFLILIPILILLVGLIRSIPSYEAIYTHARIADRVYYSFYNLYDPHPLKQGVLEVIVQDAAYSLDPRIDLDLFKRSVREEVSELNDLLSGQYGVRVDYDDLEYHEANNSVIMIGFRIEDLSGKSKTLPRNLTIRLS